MEEIVKKKKKHLRPWAKVTLGFLIVLGICQLFILFIAKPVQVSGQSMAPTLDDGEYGLMCMFDKTVNGVDRGDIVIVQTDSGKAIIKRVIGMPGDTIECLNGKIYINGTALDESSYLSSSVKTSDFSKVVLEENQYYCLGDNREDSTDSRVYGTFDISQILGTYTHLWG